ncbi:MAG: gliding motility lipoprotein GldH [Bacteroidetes bacterium]|nr:MAG: gliding motility lipoprotein GldH [Bacteroidota bacterium]
MIKNLTGVFLLILLFSSCKNDVVIQDFCSVPNHQWHLDSSCFIQKKISDIDGTVDFYINIRHANTYKYSNLIVFLKTVAPSRKITVDTINCIIADDRGKWLGSGFGDIIEDKVLFKRNVSLPDSGIYLFEISHGMRDTVLQDIIDIGITIEKHDN